MKTLSQLQVERLVQAWYTGGDEAAKAVAQKMSKEDGDGVSNVLSRISALVWKETR